ncbi:bifunctional UDP-N-acetylmuramoyl-tripeptide:D-alanyl-D-alanine ligase/alanine racemase [Sphingobacterium sp. lm-10]|uniref:bifunctional UDP-N-acetylmuramoyl-tripeptide:D-alanyl-D-alanine ligase/alanine racemase n=1 Tax=Sphingobacterium sp. lm-10 TaxID=2944904 RepID=UPI00202150C2|nr:bifunctional UDP-N-acetylmuramoyl-tripeptide:D-alanyl-D-alanine ligase/alanine racemase [Sphingobacterium sp. lm-10]MCL7987225.1 bifunctional UDP-N-acetylmuramoyl-tripeptide:D-alanyl-D-alanine ligase/alanine racemase [Sphingobacterium sp. lm-10]
MYLVSEIARIISAQKTILPVADLIITELVYDSRQVYHSEKSLFFAIRAVRDGHRYIAAAYERGVRSFVVSNTDLEVSLFPDANFLWVEDVIKALQALATHQRNRFHYPIIGITGSNGKTIVKEWLYQLLSPEKKVYQSPKSYNSQLGVSLSLWELSDQYDIALIEAGISLEGEMQRLADMIQPDIGVLTNIGVAHADGFPSKQAKLAQKLKLFQKSKVLIYPAKYVLDKQGISVAQPLSWGSEEQNHWQIISLDIGNTSCEVVLREQQADFHLTIPFIDQASIENCLTCVFVMRHLAYEWSTILLRIRNLEAVEMRLQLKSGINNCSVIDDSYSNDLGALKIALDFLERQHQHSKRTLILSEIMGLPEAPKYIDKLRVLLSAYRLNRLIWVGTAVDALESLNCEVLTFSDTEDLDRNWPTLVFSDETILVKGGRTFHFETIVKRLTAKSHGTVLEINLNAIEHNLKQYRSLLPTDVKLMAMVKAFSYGSGSFEVANMLQYNAVDYLTVAFVDEGVELRQGGISLPIMVLSPDESTFDRLVIHHLEPEIYSFRILHAFIDYLNGKQIIDYPIHIKLDTGMHRLGFLSAELPQLITALKATNAIKVISIFSHLVAAGSRTESVFTEQQIEEYGVSVAKLEEALGYQVIKHLCNTSGIVRWPSAYFDMVRLGIGLYGVDLNASGLDIWPTSQLKTTITQIKTLKKGDTVGYDRRGVLERDGKIATVKIGYADGYDRRFGNGVGTMLIRGQSVPTIGNICMDMCMLDITDQDAAEGDEVIVFPDIKTMARKISVIPYELLVNISARVKRVYYYQ